jgi:putative ABC transport system permease protein
MRPQHWVYTIPLRLRSLFRRRQADQELDDELRDHVERKTEEYIAKDLPPAVARRQALLEIGGIEKRKEECRDTRRVKWIQDLAQDLHFGLRMLRKSPSFTAVAVLTLALGIGANTAIFSLLDAVLLRPLPYSQPDRLFQLFPTQAGYSMVATSYPDFEDWKKQSRTFDAMAAYEQDDLNLTGTSNPERLRALLSTPGLFALLGTHLVLGREFGPDDGQHVALLSHGLWQRRFASDPGIIGKSIYLNDSAYTVMGVLPPRFYFPPVEYEGELTAEIFVPAVPNRDPAWNYLRVIGRLAPGVTEQQAQAEMNGIAARLAETYPNSGHGPRIVLSPLPEVAASGVRQTAWILFGAVAFVLLIACANVANLLLARGATREHEIAVRNIVGATRFRIMRQLLTENLLLAAFGGLLGILLANWTLPVLASAVPENTMFFTRIHDVGVHLDSAVLAFSGLVVVLSGLLFGVLPAWRAARTAPTPRATLPTRKMRGALVALEVALSLMLLAGAGLMLRSLIRLMDVDLGFQPQGLITMDLNLSGKRYAALQKQAAFFDQVLQRLRSLPSVLSAGAVTDLPLTRNDTWNGFEIAGIRPSKGTAGYHAVSPDYFRTMGIPLLRGRLLMDSDAADSPLVGVISRHMAQKYWPHQNPIGASIVVYRFSSTLTPKGTSVQFKPEQLEIVGVVGDVRQLGLDTPPASELYMPYRQWPSNEMSLVVRTKAEPSSLIPVIEKGVWSVDPDQPLTEIRTMDQWIAAEAAARRFVLQLIGAFALIALVLAAVGIYGVLSYWMRQRTREIGIRMALGAQKQDVLRMVVGQGLKMALIGVVIGIFGALALTRFLSSLLYRVKPTDSLTFIAVSILLIAVALVACYIPARRAMKVDPMVALRYE